MKITYISHATLLIEVDNLKIVTDPWVKGAAYCDQWFLYPKAQNAELIQDADYVLYTHGHEDHLHLESLRMIDTNATVFYPYSWYGGIVPFLNGEGYSNVIEVLNEKTVFIEDKVKVTYLSNNLDNVIVIETNDTVLVNINDALPSASAEMIDHFISKINKRWKKIDYVFSSYGGASYFPNTVHYHKKHDVEIAEARELFFIANFCKIVQGLNPTYAVPFATDFILLDDNQRWINETKFPRSSIKQYYLEYTKGSGASEIIEAYSGDTFENNSFHKKSIHSPKLTKVALNQAIESEFKNELHQKRNPVFLADDQLLKVFEKLKKHIVEKKYIIPEDIRKNIKFAIKITDAKKNNFAIINFRDETNLFSIHGTPPSDIDLLIELKSKTLEYTIDNEWGGDALIIGYGAEVFIYNEDSVIKEYENYCIRLLSRYPNTREYLKREPFRALKYLLSDNTKRMNLVNKIMGNTHKNIDYFDSKLGKRELWLTKSKCDVCKACNI